MRYLKKGQIVSKYKPNKKVKEVLNDFNAKFEDARTQKESPYRFLQDRQHEEFIQDCKDLFTGYVTKRDQSWKARVFKPYTRNKVIQVVAQLVSCLFHIIPNSLCSMVRTKAIWDNMEEARTSLAKDGSCIYTCNYLSESGNVHKLVTKYKDMDSAKVLIIPIVKDGVITWSRFTQADIDKMREEDDNFEGERLCKPSAKKDIYCDRDWET